MSKKRKGKARGHYIEPQIQRGRVLASGRVLMAQDKECTMTINSKCPDKWLFVDLEDGNIWHITKTGKKGIYPQWREASLREVQEMCDIATMRLASGREVRER